MSIIECSNLSKQYKNIKALDNLSFTVEENKIIGFIGRNGAGKTTFLKSCAGYLLPTSGTLRIFDEPVFENLNVLSKLVFIDEEIQYDDGLSLSEILFLAEHYYSNWDREFAKKLLNYFNLDTKRKYKKLSRGMKTQFNIIIGISSRMPLTLFDEPTLGLDAAFRKEFYKILLQDYMKYPRTIVIFSHLLSEMENMLEELILIKNGSLVFQKPIDEVQTYGLYLSGKEEVLQKVIQNKKILSNEKIGSLLCVGIEKSSLCDKELASLHDFNIDITPMSAQDVCIHLTSDGRVGVYDE